jgi:hypothetical protein
MTEQAIKECLALTDTAKTDARQLRGASRTAKLKHEREGRSVNRPKVRRALVRLTSRAVRGVLQ